jgi:hypothetical protein
VSPNRWTTWKSPRGYQGFLDLNPQLKNIHFLTSLRTGFIVIIIIIIIINNKNMHEKLSKRTINNNYNAIFPLVRIE